MKIAVYFSAFFGLLIVSTADAMASGHPLEAAVANVCIVVLVFICDRNLP